MGILFRVEFERELLDIALNTEVHTFSMGHSELEVGMVVPNTLPWKDGRTSTRSHKLHW